jgi:hypothetical protein
MTGNLAEYSNMIDWDARQLMAILIPYLQKYGKAMKADIVKLVGDHLSDKQLRKFIDELVSNKVLDKNGTLIMII